MLPSFVALANYWHVFWTKILNCGTKIHWALVMCLIRLHSNIFNCTNATSLALYSSIFRTDVREFVDTWPKMVWNRCHTILEEVYALICGCSHIFSRAMSCTSNVLENIGPGSTISGRSSVMGREWAGKISSVYIQ